MLDTQSIQEPTAATTKSAATTDDIEDVIITLQDSLDPPHIHFGEGFYKNAFYPILLLHNLTIFYGVDKIESEWNHQLNFSPKALITTTCSLSHGSVTYYKWKRLRQMF